MRYLYFEKQMSQVFAEHKTSTPPEVFTRWQILKTKTENNIR